MFTFSGGLVSSLSDLSFEFFPEFDFVVLSEGEEDVALLGDGEVVVDSGDVFTVGVVDFGGYFVGLVLVFFFEES